MKKRMILFLLILISLTSFASASMTILDEYGNGITYQVNINIEEGWNIISGLSDVREIQSDSQIKKEDIGAMWYYSPVKKEYLNMLYPNMNEDEFNEDVSYYGGDNLILNSAKWIYSKKSGTLKYATAAYKKKEDKKLVKGWNFVSITPEITIDINSAGPEEEEKYTFDAMKGDCNIQKAYFFDSKNQEWFDYRLTEELDSALNGVGAVIKVSEDCAMSKSNNINIPPSLPLN